MAEKSSFTEKKNKVKKAAKVYTMRVVFIIMCFMTLVFILSSFAAPHMNNWFGKQQFRTWNDGWQQVYSDGSRKDVTLPGRAVVEDGAEGYTISATLPVIHLDEVMIFRSSMQDVTVKIDGVTVLVYTDAATRLFGDSSPSAWIRLELDPADCGREITMTFESPEKNYAGIMNLIYVGNEAGILFNLMRDNLVLMVFGVIIMLTGAGLVCFCVFSRINHFHYITIRQLTYVGVFAVCIGAWFVCECKVRQSYFGNSTLLSNLAFYSLMLFPMPLLMYVDDVLYAKFHKVYTVAEILVALNFFANIILAYTGLRSFSKTLIHTQGLLLVLGIMILVTAVVFAVKYKKKENSMVPFFAQIGCFIGGGVAEFIIYKLGSYTKNGAGLAIGVFLFLASTLISAFIDVLKAYTKRKEEAAKNSSKTIFLGALSHELRTPMYAISGMADLLSESDLDYNSRNKVELIRHATENMISILNDVLEVSEIEAEEIKIVESRYDLAPMLQELLELTGFRLGDKKVLVDFEVEGKVPTSLYGDGNRIKQILNILLDNAAKFTGEGNIRMTISFDWKERDKGTLRFKVADTGNGISGAEQKKLFDLFGATERIYGNTIEGSGVGLYICKEVADRLGGTLQFSSEEGKGSVFTFEVPQLYLGTKLLQTEEIRETENHKADRTVQSFRAPLSNIMVVDDNRVNLQVAYAMVKRYGGSVELVNSGEEALELIKKDHSFDLILLDLMMPGMDGYRFAELVRDMDDPYYKELPILALSANAINGVREKALAAGMDDYLTKPLRTSELDTALHTYLPKRKQVAADEENTDRDSQRNREMMEAYRPFLEKMDGLNVERGLQYCMNAPDIYFTVARAYAQPELGERIRVSYEQENYSDYTIHVHALKSSSRNIGAEALGELAYELEMAGKRGDIDFIKTHHKKCMDVYETIYHTVGQAVAAMVLPEKKDKEDGDPAMLKHLLDELKVALEDIDPIASQEILEHMNIYRYGNEELENLIRDMLSDIDNYDFDKAEEKLDRLQQMTAAMES